MSGAPVRVGIIGAGNISDEYLATLQAASSVEVIGISDLDHERAAAQAARFGVPFAGSTEELLALPALELIVNLTVPAVHAQVALQALTAGKHVWGEKPLTLDRASARAVLDAAVAAGLRVGNAPDTVLGRGIQHSQRLIADGRIGTPQTVLTLMQGPGPDTWHPRPDFLFARGAGPLFDIGPYYLTTLALLFGPIETVQALGHRAFDVRTVPYGERAGARIPVEVWTHVSVLTRFRSGVVGTSIYSFDSPVRRQLFEVTGSGGTLTVPVSGFDGPNLLVPAGRPQPEQTELVPPGVERERGIGVVEMAEAIRADREPRASGALAYHVLDAMIAIEESIDADVPVRVESTFDPVPALDPEWGTSAS
ncbi:MULTISPECIES: Gfo/Idh/MocA family protein [Microbacterium]|uniref:Gfo/Idh/MocA family oxidoreductase n=1 Tax=Microbacterium aurugineum TaxID=2851642 RepID=A0ABY4IY77_9MICO|nr:MULTISPECIES: Gfo/Idh/MocA family oxidoreductase [Microbacterium]QEA27711.1 Gfo/Idh/MocA family oxidoreductase [Microbacterium sp. CBA3102]UPL16393.1 Gfo/Idh/MocA family oxidoreductase [Microbacterium aurugineum]